jgi:hypothetical protein
MTVSLSRSTKPWIERATSVENSDNIPKGRPLRDVPKPTIEIFFYSDFNNLR